MPDFFGNAAGVVIAYGILQVMIKSYDKDKKLKRWYPLFTFGASVFAAVVLGLGGLIGFTFREVLFNSVLIFTAETLGYGTLFDKSNKK